MSDRRVWCMFFSATGGVKKIATQLTRAMCEKLECDRRTLDISTPGGREKPPVFEAGDIVVCALPVYAGRVPNVLLPYLKTIQGNGAYAVPVVVYGNRAYDNALRELQGLLEEGGCTCIAGAAFIAQHSFSDTLAEGRPDITDVNAVSTFSYQLCAKILDGDFSPVTLPGEYPPPAYYQPKDAEGQALNFLKAKPRTGPGCNGCGFCAEVCPTGAIDHADPTSVTGVCIKCNACVKRCVRHAKFFDDPAYLAHKQLLEETCSERKEPELFW